jgi:hypothetical protein
VAEIPFVSTRVKVSSKSSAPSSKGGKKMKTIDEKYIYVFKGKKKTEFTPVEPAILFSAAGLHEPSSL